MMYKDIFWLTYQFCDLTRFDSTFSLTLSNHDIFWQAMIQPLVNVAWNWAEESPKAQESYRPMSVKDIYGYPDMP